MLFSTISNQEVTYTALNKSLTKLIAAVKISGNFSTDLLRRHGII